MTDFTWVPEGATPLEPSDMEALIPTWIAFRSDLNEVEQENIAEAMLWASDRRWTTDQIDREAIKDLHRRMFGRVWKWAGQFRKTDTNIGVAWYQIQTEVENLVLDLLAQTADPKRLPWAAEELAVRFHYRLVAIHPFRNGNGRHARLVADLILAALGRRPLSWGGSGHLTDAGPVRTEYIRVLREVDSSGDYTRLLAFARRP